MSAVPVDLWNFGVNSWEPVWVINPSNIHMTNSCRCSADAVSKEHRINVELVPNSRRPYVSHALQRRAPRCAVPPCNGGNSTLATWGSKTWSSCRHGATRGTPRYYSWASRDFVIYLVLCPPNKAFAVGPLRWSRTNNGAARRGGPHPGPRRLRHFEVVVLSVWAETTTKQAPLPFSQARGSRQAPC